VTFVLPRIPPAGADIFFCDYSQRPRAGRERAAAELEMSGGGPLSVVRVKDIRIGVPSLDVATRAWGHLTENNAPVTGGVIHFGAGPDIRLVASETPQIQRLEVVVKNLSKTKAFLLERHILSEDKPESVAIDPKSIDGLTLLFIQE
jgi:hypothetical protein